MGKLLMQTMMSEKLKNTQKRIRRWKLSKKRGGNWNRVLLRLYLLSKSRRRNGRSGKVKIGGLESRKWQRAERERLRRALWLKSLHKVKGLRNQANYNSSSKENLKRINCFSCYTALRFTALICFWTLLSLKSIRTEDTNSLVSSVLQRRCHFSEGVCFWILIRFHILLLQPQVKGLFCFLFSET